MTGDLSQCSDRDLAALALSGRQDAYREFLARYKITVFRLIRSNVGDDNEAMDLTQESFVAGFAALARYDGERPFRIWITRIALNKCRDWRRRRAVRRLFAFALPLDDASIQVAEDRVLPDEEVAGREEMARVARAIAELPAALREPLVLHTLQDLSQAETAVTLSISEKAVETRIRRARARLTERLGRT